MRRDALVGAGRRHRAVAVFATVSLGMAISLAGAQLAFAAEDGSAAFADGWRKEVALTDPNGGDKKPHCVAWVDDSWLIVERRDTADEVEWQIVLAEVDKDDEPPTIGSNPKVPGGLRLNYRGGRFFIHDDWGQLRCRRQQKSADAPFPALEIPPNDVQPGGTMMGRADRVLYGRTMGGWQVIAGGLEGEKAEFVLRIYCLDVGAFHFESFSDRSGVVNYQVGAEYGSVQSSTLWDDGELLVVKRMHEWLVNLYRDQLKKLLEKRKQLIGAAPPAIFAANWLNGDAVALDDLKGKAALVYFAGSYSKLIADQLSAIDELVGKYRDRGLEVFAVIPAEDEEVYAAICEKRGWKFPLAVDPHGGPVARRFSVTDKPCYFLVDRDGKIAVGEYQGRIAPRHYMPPPRLPNAEEIERLLGAAKQQ